MTTAKTRKDLINIIINPVKKESTPDSSAYTNTYKFSRNNKSIMLPSLSIFLLAYNEEKNIEQSVRDAFAVAKKVARRYEVLIVYYEGSSDGTLAILRKLQKRKEYRSLRIVTQKREQKGYGTALRLGIDAAKHEYVFYTDGDRQFDLNDLTLLARHAPRYDIVSGYRKKRSDLIMRRVAAAVYNIILQIVFDTGVRDVDSALKIYRRAIFERIRVRCTSGMADAEILIKARRAGFRIREVGVPHYHREYGDGQFSNKLGLIKPAVVLGLLRDMHRVWQDVNAPRARSRSDRRTQGIKRKGRGKRL